MGSEMCIRDSEYGVRMSKMIDDVTKDIPDRMDEAEEETEE